MHAYPAPAVRAATLPPPPAPAVRAAGLTATYVPTDAGAIIRVTGHGLDGPADYAIAAESIGRRTPLVDACRYTRRFLGGAAA